MNTQPNANMNMLKQQIIMMASMKQDSTVFGTVISIVFLTIVEYVFEVLPGILKNISSVVYSYFKKESEKISITTTLVNGTKTTKASILFEKLYKEQHQQSELVDALIEHMSNLNETTRLKFQGSYFMNNYEAFEIGYRDIKCKLIHILFDHDIHTINFEIFSYELTLNELKQW